MRLPAIVPLIEMVWDRACRGRFPKHQEKFEAARAVPITEPRFFVLPCLLGPVPDDQELHNGLHAAASQLFNPCLMSAVWLLAFFAYGRQQHLC